MEAHPTTQKLYTPERQVLRNSIHNMLSKHVVLNRYPHFLIWRSTWIQWQTCLCDVSTSPFHLSAHLSSLSKTFSMLILVSISRLIFWVICFLYLIYLCTCKVWLPVCLSACLPVCHFCLSLCLSGCLPACLFVCLSVCLSACLPVCLHISLCVCVCPCFSLSWTLSANLSVFLFLCLSVCLLGWLLGSLSLCLSSIYRFASLAVCPSA